MQNLSRGRWKRLCKAVTAHSDSPGGEPLPPAAAATPLRTVSPLWAGLHALRSLRWHEETIEHRRRAAERTMLPLPLCAAASTAWAAHAKRTTSSFMHAPLSFS